MTGLDMTGDVRRLWLVGLGASCCWGKTRIPCNSWIHKERPFQDVGEGILPTRSLTRGELDLEIRLAWEVFLMT